ncbi:MAG: ABC transporter substrate-binding protein, partial [Candidatus Krumholzibacteriia bacterium]
MDRNDLPIVGASTGGVRMAGEVETITMGRSGRMRSLACALAVLGVVSSCSRSKTPAESTRLVLGLQEEPAILNNILQLYKPSRVINNCIFSRFVTFDDQMNLVPDLITEIPTTENGGASENGLTYTYHLRPAARWHDGTPLTSDDVRFTYEVIMHPEAGAESQQGWERVERVETPDAHTVVFHLREPYASFVFDTFFDEDVLPRHLLEEHVGPQFRNAPFHKAPVGSGPFKFKEWVAASHITVERFDDYYRGAPQIDEIVFKFVPEASALGIQLHAGDVDGWDGADAGQLARLEKIAGVRVYRTPALSYQHVTFNCRHPI